MKKVIHNVNPWNELYYNNCYYSALFPMLLHYCRSITPVLLENIYTFSGTDENGITINRQELKKHDDVLREMGIVETMKPKADIVSSIKDSIDRDVLPMVFIDCFYETIRPDAFQKHHCGHIILVYGYDDESCTFEVLEHSYIDSFTYKRAKFSYSEMTLCYNNFKSDHDPEFTGLLEFSISGEPVDLQAYHKMTVMNYIKSMEENRSELYEGINAVRETLIKHRDKGDINVFNSNDAELFLKIAKIKTMERYAIKKVFYADDSITNLLDNVIAAWNIAAGMIGLGAPPQKRFDTIIYRLIAATEIEMEFWNKAYELMEQQKYEFNFLPLDLSKVFNSICIRSTSEPIEGIQPWRISGDLTDPDTLPTGNTIINIEGVPIWMPDKGDLVLDNIMAEGQKIFFAPNKYKRIYVLGIGEFREEMLLLREDETVEKSILFFHDAWTGIDIWNSGPQDERIIAKIKGYGLNKSIQAFYLLRIEINSWDKVIDAIKLPDCPLMRIFAVTLES